MRGAFHYGHQSFLRKLLGATDTLVVAVGGDGSTHASPFTRTKRTTFPNFETRFFEIVPNGYDFDNDHLSLDKTNDLVKLIKEMPVHREATKGQVTHYEGWCETEIIYIDVTVNNPTGIGFNAFAGSENLMVESPANAAIYKAAFTGK